MEVEWLKEEVRLRNEEEKWLQGEKFRKQKAVKKLREVFIRFKKEKEVGWKLFLLLLCDNKLLRFLQYYNLIMLEFYSIVVFVYIVFLIC